MAVRHLNAGQRELAPIEWPRCFNTDQKQWSVMFPEYKDRMEAIGGNAMLQLSLLETEKEIE